MVTKVSHLPAVFLFWRFKACCHFLFAYALIFSSTLQSPITLLEPTRVLQKCNQTEVALNQRTAVEAESGNQHGDIKISCNS